MLSLLNQHVPCSLKIHEKELSSCSVFHVFFLFFSVSCWWWDDIINVWAMVRENEIFFFFFCWKRNSILPFVLAEANLNLLNFYCCWWILGKWFFSGVQVILWATYGGFYGENLVRECSRISVCDSIENVIEFSMLKRWISEAA